VIYKTAKYLCNLCLQCTYGGNMGKIKVTISLREYLWKRYKEYCKKNDLIASYEFQKFIKKQLK